MKIAEKSQERFMTRFQSCLRSQALNYFVALCECQELVTCEIYREESETGVVLVIDCPSKPIAQKLWSERSLLVSSAHLLGLAERLILKMKGHRYGTASSSINSNGDEPMITTTSTKSGCQYQDLLLSVAHSKFPTFVIEIPKNWQWGVPQHVVLTSSQVTSFSGRTAPRWHKEDVTILYEKQEFERIHSDLMRELSNNTDTMRASISDYDYHSYTVDSSRESLTAKEKQLYVSDLEIMYLQDIDMLVRVCHCKQRQPL